jgi:signal transduction histidine kinase
MRFILPRRYRVRLGFARRAWQDLSLARKAMVPASAAIFLVAGALTLITYVSAEDSLRTQVDRQVSNELGVFERLYAIRQGPGPIRLTEPVARAAAHEMVGLMGGFAAVYQGDRLLAADGLDGPLAAEARRLPADFRRADPADRVISARFNHTPYVIALHPLSRPDGTREGTFVRGLPEKQISDMLLKHAWGIFSVAGTVMLLALVSLAWLTQELARPLKRLATASRSLLEDGTHERLPDSQGADEVGRLAHEFRAIAERLTQQKLALEEKDRLRGQLLEKLISAQEDERRRISRELHDQTGQSLTSLLVGLKVLEGASSVEDLAARTSSLKDLVHQTLDEVHRLSVELRPAMLDDLGLVAALREMARGFEAAHRVPVTVTVRGLEQRLSPLLEATVYRVVQEALTNVAKYAAARHVVVTLERVDGEVRSSVVDDGRGFDPATRLGPDHRPSLGILGMQERIGLLGGHFDLDSAPGSGTRVAFSIPLTIGASPWQTPSAS